MKIVMLLKNKLIRAYDDLDKAIKVLIDAPVIVDKNYQMLLKQLMILLKINGRFMEST